MKLTKADAKIIEGLLIGQQGSWVGLTEREERLLTKVRKCLGKKV